MPALVAADTAALAGHTAEAGQEPEARADTAAAEQAAGTAVAAREPADKAADSTGCHKVPAVPADKEPEVRADTAAVHTAAEQVPAQVAADTAAVAGHTAEAGQEPEARADTAAAELAAVPAVQLHRKEPGY